MTFDAGQSTLSTLAPRRAAAAVYQVYLDANAAHQQFGGHATAMSRGVQSAATQSCSDLVAPLPDLPGPR